MKSWRFDGPGAAIEELIADARASPQAFAQRTLKAESGCTCELCGQLFPLWTTYQLTCSIEDGKPIFTRHHVFCPRSNL